MVATNTGKCGWMFKEGLSFSMFLATDSVEAAVYVL